MNRREFDHWMSRTGYSDINDWNFQSINDYLYYWIRNNLGYYALIKEKSYDYQVLVQGFKDYGAFTRTK